MYELTPGWEQYYEEQNPVERKKLLEYLRDTLEDDGANEFRRVVFEKRSKDYGNNRNPKNNRNQKKAGGSENSERLVDRYLWQLVFLPGLYKKRGYFFSNVAKELQSVEEELLLAGFRPLNEAEEAALYWEIRNAADRYFATCSGARYGKKAFGMKLADNEEKRQKACEDAWIISRGLLIHTGKEEEMRVFGDAVRDSYFNYDVNAREMYEEYDRLHREEAVKKEKHKKRSKQ